MKLDSLEDIRRRCTVDAQGCWIWQWARGSDGYGRARVGRRGKLRTVHRLAFALAHGREATGMVCHRCDVPACVNPAHLYEGTPEDNWGDVVARHPDVVERMREESQARSRRLFGAGVCTRYGEANPAAKLTAAGAAEIRRRAARGETLRAIAQAVGVSHVTVWKVIRGVTWRPDPSHEGQR